MFIFNLLSFRLRNLTKFKNSIFRIKCGKTYFNAREGHNEGRGSSCRLGPGRDLLTRLNTFRT